MLSECQMFPAISGLVFSTKLAQYWLVERRQCRNVPNAANSLIRFPPQVIFAKSAQTR
jgi:hypothetical protein